MRQYSQVLRVNSLMKLMLLAANANRVAYFTLKRTTIPPKFWKLRSGYLSSSGARKLPLITTGYKPFDSQPKFIFGIAWKSLYGRISSWTQSDKAESISFLCHKVSLFGVRESSKYIFNHCETIFKLPTLFDFKEKKECKVAFIRFRKYISLI